MLLFLAYIKEGESTLKKRMKMVEENKVEIKNKKEADEIFCPSCGKPVKKDAVICVNCGVQIGKMSANNIPKSKTTAILLAVFLGLWTWIYTYQKDAWKFWFNLALSLFTLGIWGFAAWIWAIIESASRSNEFYTEFPNK